MSRDRTRKILPAKTQTAALFATFILLGCDGSIQLCGQYACVAYQDDCNRNSNSQSNCSTRIRQCEAAGSIRDRAPQIINQLREAERSCGATSNTSSTNNTDLSNGDNTPNNANTALVWDNTLAQVSVPHARDMAANRFESFIGTNGLSTDERVRLAGINATIVTESINTGPQTSAEAINEWLDIDTDCSFLLNPQTTRVGMACAVSTLGNGGPYWSLLLASPEP